MADMPIEGAHSNRTGCEFMVVPALHELDISTAELDGSWRIKVDAVQCLPLHDGDTYSAKTTSCFEAAPSLSSILTKILMVMQIRSFTETKVLLMDDMVCPAWGYLVLSAVFLVLELWRMGSYVLCLERNEATNLLEPRNLGEAWLPLD